MTDVSKWADNDIAEVQPSAEEVEAAGQVGFDFDVVAVKPPPPATVESAEDIALVLGDPDAQSSRPPFGAWLIGQTSRKGWIADLAKAAKADPRFPKQGEPDDVRKRLRELGAEGDAYEALDDAELDWLAL
jgi:hypothetical protein